MILHRRRERAYKPRRRHQGFNDLLNAHALCGAVFGAALLVLPHRLFTSLSGEGYSHLAHEIARCYGALTMAQSWFAARTRHIADGRVRRMLAESYSLCYAVTALALGKAAYAAPNLHGFIGALLSFSLAATYAYFRFVLTIKDFEQLP